MHQPRLSFIKVSNHLIIPVKISINRKEVKKNSNQSKNEAFQIIKPTQQNKSHKSLLSLKNSIRIYLSNNEIEEICQLIKDDVISNLFEKNLIELKQQMSKESGNITILIDKNIWKLNLIINYKFIESFRSNNFEVKYNCIIAEKTLQVSEESEDEKPIFNFKYKRANSTTSGIKIEVLHKNNSFLNNKIIQ